MPHVLIQLFSKVIKQGSSNDDAQMILDTLKAQKFGRVNLLDVELETYLEHGRFDLAEQLIKVRCSRLIHN